jgi:hypothetical protein
VEGALRPAIALRVNERYEEGQAERLERRKGMSVRYSKGVTNKGVCPIDPVRGCRRNIQWGA